MANHVGRPRTKLNDLPADWESIICMAAQDGASDVELRCLLGAYSLPIYDGFLNYPFYISSFHYIPISM